MNSVKAEQVKIELWYKNVYGVSSVRRSGGLVLFQNEEINFRFVSLLKYYIMVDIWVQGSTTVRVIRVYGWSDQVNKFKTWDFFSELIMECTMFLMVGGYFNEIFVSNEKEGGQIRV